MKKIILTGDRPTGKLHIGHFVGSLRERVRIQNSNDYDEMYIMIADAQALTDNYDDINKVKSNIVEVALDYLAVGLDPDKVTLFIQSEIPELTELTFYYMNLVTLARLKRNPTVKEEMNLKGMENTIPMGFLTYPISQAADITGFMATIVPVGDDQLPMIEQTREIVRSFNNLYGETLVEPKAVLPNNKVCFRLPGIDGKAKMSKSLGNTINLADDEKTLRDKVYSMYTDPNHIKVSDPGKVEGNVVFTYLEAFATDELIQKYSTDYKNLDEIKAHYRKGGLGDMKIKGLLFNILNEILTPIRLKRQELEKDKQAVLDILFKGSDKARKVVQNTLNNVKSAMGINYRK